jgi:hypothetical protein
MAHILHSRHLVYADKIFLTNLLSSILSRWLSQLIWYLSFLLRIGILWRIDPLLSNAGKAYAANNTEAAFSVVRVRTVAMQRTLNTFSHTRWRHTTIEKHFFCVVCATHCGTWHVFAIGGASIYETWCAYHGTWAHLNGVLHKSFTSVCVYMRITISLLGSDSLKTLPRQRIHANNRRVIGRIVFYVVRFVWTKIGD